MSRLVHGLPSLSQTDYLPLVELSIFLSLALVVVYFLTTTKSLASCKFLSSISFGDMSKMLFLCALAIHFGNYFYSGVAKLSMDGGITEWVMHSQTQYMTEAAAVIGLLPLTPWPEFAATLHKFLGEWYVVSNFVVLVSQLVTLLAIWRTRWAMLLTVFFDLTHIVIFLATGILFWKWILLNLLFVIGLARLNKYQLKSWQSWLLITIIPAANIFFFAATLAWYDSPGLLHHRLVAVTDTGHRITVPSNFFLDASVTVAQNRLGTPPGHFPTSTWGGTQSQSIRNDALNDCTFTDKAVVRALNEHQLRSFVINYHRYVERNLNEYDQFAFDLHPHHIYSNPNAYRDFYAFDLRTVKKYEYVIESVCLDGN